MTFDNRIVEHQALAEVALRLKHWPEAQSELEALLAIAPDDATAWNNLGVALEHQHKGREALEAYARSAALLPAGPLPRWNLIIGMQRYLGFAAAIVLFKIIEILLQFLPLSSAEHTAALMISLLLLALGSVVFYQRRREQLSAETWHAYKSEMARTRQLRFGGLAFVFVGFLVFAVVLFVVVQLPGGASDGTVVLVIVAGLCWLIVARLLWGRVILPRLEARSAARVADEL